MTTPTRDHAASEAFDTVTLGEAVHVVARRWVVLLVVVALGAGAALLAWSLVPASYTATATVDITADPRSQVPPSEVTAATESDIIRSRSVSQLAATALRTTHPTVSAEQVRRSVSVSGPRLTRVLQISYAASSPRAAADGANAVADAYLSFRRDLARQRLTAQERRVRTHLNAALARINNLPLRMGVQRQFARSEAKRLTAQLNTLEWTTVDSGRLIDGATPPTSSSGSSLAVYLVGGVLVGILVGVPVTILADRIAIGRRR